MPSEDTITAPQAIRRDVLTLNHLSITRQLAVMDDFCCQSQQFYRKEILS